LCECMFAPATVVPSPLSATPPYSVNRL
jgi:hypothetical protein